MNQIYDAGAQSNLSVTGEILNVLMTLLFFAANGHHTLLRMMVTSGQIVGFGGVAIGPEVADAALELFVECTVLAVKLCMPILAAELLGQVGMGIFDEGDSANQCVFHQYRTEGADRAHSVAAADFTLQRIFTAD